MRLCVHETGWRAAGLGIAASLAVTLTAALPAPAGAETLESRLPAASGRMDLLKWGVPYGEPASLDPVRGNDNSPAFAASNTCDGLLRLTPRIRAGAGDGGILGFRRRQPQPDLPSA